MISIHSALLEGAASPPDAFAKLLFGAREQLARHVRAVLQRLADPREPLRSEEDGRHDHDVLLVLRDRGVNGGQLLVQIGYPSKSPHSAHAQATCPYP